MSNKGGSPSYNPHTTPKYLQDFSKALAGEVRILLQEVGKLRDERSQLQSEIAELMAMKAKHGGGYAPEWAPKAIEGPPGMGMGMGMGGMGMGMGMGMGEEPPLPPPMIEDTPVQARPGWRSVGPKKAPGEKRQRGRKAIAPPPPDPAPAQIAYEPPPPQTMPAWAQWRPNPLLAPTPLVSPSRIPATPPPRAGLFGASTPPPGGR